MPEPIHIEPKELERLAATGMSVREMAARLGMSKATLLKYKAKTDQLARAYRRGRLAFARNQDKQVVNRRGRLVLVKTVRDHADHAQAGLAQAGLVQTPAARIMALIESQGQASWIEMLKATRLNDNGLGLLLVDMLDRKEVEPVECPGFDERLYVKGRKVA